MRPRSMRRIAGGQGAHDLQRDAVPVASMTFCAGATTRRPASIAAATDFA